MWIQLAHRVLVTFTDTPSGIIVIFTWCGVVCGVWCVMCNDEYILVDLVCRRLLHFSNTCGVVATRLGGDGC